MPFLFYPSYFFAFANSVSIGSSYCSCNLCSSAFRLSIKASLPGSLYMLCISIGSFISMSTPGNNILNLIGKFFSSFKEELTSRIEKDDRIWFPYCLSLSEKLKEYQSSGQIEALHLGTEQRLEDPIEALLADLKSIMVKHLSGDYNENLCYAVIFAISSLEKDIKQHNRIRYRILTPMVSAMEKLCI